MCIWHGYTTGDIPRKPAAQTERLLMKNTCGGCELFFDSIDPHYRNICAI